MHKTIVFLFLFIVLNSYSQVSSKVDFSKRKFQDKDWSWTPKQLNSANTFRKISYMTLDEKMVIYYINLARIDSKLFAKTILKDYIDSIGSATPNIISLKRSLQIQKNVKPLVPEKELYQLAKNFAIFQSKTGKTGTVNFKSRVKKLCESQKYKDIKELMVYSKEKPLDVAITILAGSSDLNIFDKEISKQQNNLIFSKKMNTLGLSIKKHPEYDYVCIFEVGNKNLEVKKPLTPKEKAKIAKKEKKLEFKNRKRFDKGKEPKKIKKDKNIMDCGEEKVETETTE